VEKGKTDTKVDAVSVPEEISEGVELRFDGHEDVERVLSMTKVLFEGDVKKLSERICARNRDKRDAMEERARERGFADTDPSPRVTRPDGMSASGPRELTKRKVNAPKIDRSVMVKGVAKNESSIGGSRGGGDGEEELAEPEVRDDKQSFARNHALEVRVMKSSRVDDAGELVGS
jgi:hypothetical protein